VEWANTQSLDPEKCVNYLLEVTRTSPRRRSGTYDNPADPGRVSSSSEESASIELSNAQVESLQEYLAQATPFPVVKGTLSIMDFPEEVELAGIPNIIRRIVQKLKRERPRPKKCDIDAEHLETSALLQIFDTVATKLEKISINNLETPIDPQIVVGTWNNASSLREFSIYGNLSFTSTDAQGLKPNTSVKEMMFVGGTYEADAVVQMLTQAKKLSSLTMTQCRVNGADKNEFEQRLLETRVGLSIDIRLIQE